MEIKNQNLFTMQDQALHNGCEVNWMVHKISVFLLNNGYDYSDDYAESIRDYRNKHPGKKVRYWVPKEINKKLPLHSDFCKNCSYFCKAKENFKFCTQLRIFTEPNFMSCNKFHVKLQKSRNKV